MGYDRTDSHTQGCSSLQGNTHVQGAGSPKKLEVSAGKTVADRTYFHTSLLPELDSEVQAICRNAVAIVQPRDDHSFNVIKLAQDRRSLTLLDYPKFFDEAFPVLNQYWTVDLNGQSFRHRTYESSLNPPVLHRKELLLPPNHPARTTFAALTAVAEQIGLFDDPNRIGFKRAWDALVAQHGFKVVGHELVPLGNDETPADDSFLLDFTGVARHLTALTRYGLSAPIQILARFGFLNGSKTIFDYGCGRGDDLRGLRENGLSAEGWDPHFAPSETKKPADLVNLGFVINVIENIHERAQALSGAYFLANELLVVSVMLTSQQSLKGRPYSDGILTSRNTFQKYYTQNELRQFIVEVLDEEPIPVGPGIFYVFKDKGAEQRFMLGRVENRKSVQRLRYLSRPTKPARISLADAKYEKHREMLESLWNLCLRYGRDPDRTELRNIVDITDSFGSLAAALRFIKSRTVRAAELLQEAAHARISDLSVYLAQLQFEKRKPYKHLDERLQRDIKLFFGDYRNAAAVGRDLLFRVANIEAIGNACHDAAVHGIGWLEDSESLQLHTSMVEQLPPLLRTYIHCGAALYGDVTNADLIKIHIRSGKLTLMTFDDFTNKPLPRMTQRIKLKLREQDFEIFDYTPPYDPPYLYRKSRFINEEFPFFSEQVAFEAALARLHLGDFSGYGPEPHEFDAMLAKRRYEVVGFSLTRSRTSPNIDAPCGRFLTYRQLIECGETQSRLGLANLPNQPDTYTALLELTLNVLDPVIEYFGMIRLTYGFSSPALSKQIPAKIAPKLDQHAAHEINRVGNLICDRMGAAVDFLVEDEDMIGVSLWIAENTNFDRMYIYGPCRPLHVSYGPQATGQIIAMLPNGLARMPRVVTADVLRSLSWT